jgi:hypothetical protein
MQLKGTEMNYYFGLALGWIIRAGGIGFIVMGIDMLIEIIDDHPDLSNWSAATFWLSSFIAISVIACIAGLVWEAALFLKGN